MDISSKLQIKPGQSIAILNAPPDLILPGTPAAATAGDASRVELARLTLEPANTQQVA